jgi:hypothetical protein
LYALLLCDALAESNWFAITVNDLSVFMALALPAACA